VGKEIFIIGGEVGVGGVNLRPCHGVLENNEESGITKEMIYRPC